MTTIADAVHAGIHALAARGDLEETERVILADIHSIRAELGRIESCIAHGHLARPSTIGSDVVGLAHRLGERAALLRCRPPEVSE